MPMNAFQWTPELRFLVALALGFLVGLERESTKVDHQGRVFAGIRTYPIISMFGFGCAWLYRIGVTFMLPAGLLSIGALTVIAYVSKIRGGRFGSTSEVTALLTFITGAMALLVDVWIPLALGVVNTMLLSEKAEMESYVERLNRVEFLATIRFLLVTVIILPILPNQEYTEFRLNPTRIWQIVILVSSVGFVGYFLSKKFGARLGLWLSGFLGGIVSSTAVTIASGRTAQKFPEQSGHALQASILAGSVMYIRILVLVWAINPAYVPLLWWRLVMLAIVGLLLSIRVRSTTTATEEPVGPGLQNPFELKPALVFAGLFVMLSIATGLVKRSVGDAGVLVLSAAVGVTDIDPFILSLVHSTEGSVKVIVVAVMVAMMSNTIVKGIYFGVLAPAARKETAWRFAVWAVAHVPFVFLS